MKVTELPGRTAWSRFNEWRVLSVSPPTRPQTQFQHRANGEGTDQLLAWLEEIRRLLPDALCAGGTGSMDTAQASIRDLETMEARNESLQAPAPIKLQYTSWWKKNSERDLEELR